MILLLVTSLVIIPTVEGAPNGYYAFVTKWGKSGEGNGEFKNPNGIAVDTSTHEVYVVDSSNGRIQKFKLANPCPKGTTPTETPGVCFVTKWGSNSVGPGDLENSNFAYPTSIAVDSSTHEVYVADTGNDRIQKFSSNGVFITTWGWPEGSDDGDLKDPMGIAVDSSTHEVYVADTGNDRIQKFILTNSCPQGTTPTETPGVCFVTKWEVSNLIQVAVNSYTHDVYVTAYADITDNSKQVIKYSKDGTMITKTPVARSIWYSGIAVGPGGVIYVTDKANYQILKFTANLAYVNKWGSSGSGNGQFHTPDGIAVDSSGLIFVSDFYDRVQVFVWKTISPPATTSSPK